MKDKKEWETKTLNDVIVDLYHGYPIKKLVNENGNLKAIKSSDISKLDSFFVWGCQTNIELENLSEYKQIEKEDLLIIKESMSSKLIGKTLLYLGEEKAVVAQEIYTLKTNINSKFLLFSLNSWKQKLQIKKAFEKSYSPARGKMIRLGDLKKLQLVLPPLNVQNLIGNYLYRMGLFEEQLKSSWRAEVETISLL